MRKKRSLYATAGALVLFLLIGGGTLWWFFLATLGERLIDGWARQAAGQGWEVRYGEIDRSGFPITVGLRVATPDIRYADPDGGRTWRAEALQFRAAVWRPRTISFRAIGAHRLDIEPGEGRLPVIATSETLAGKVYPNAAGDGWAVDATVERGSAWVPGTESEMLTFDRLGAVVDLPAPGPGRREARLQARVDRLELPREAPLGREIALIEADLGITPMLPAAWTAWALEAWRARDGAFDIDRLRLEWGPLGLAAAGRLGLDAALRPTGRVDARLAGFEETIDMLAVDGNVAERTAQTLKSVLGFVATTGADGRRQVSAPLVFREGGLLVGPVRLADLPSVLEIGR